MVLVNVNAFHATGECRQQVNKLTKIVHEIAVKMIEMWTILLSKTNACVVEVLNHPFHACKMMCVYTANLIIPNEFRHDFESFKVSLRDDWLNITNVLKLNLRRILSIPHSLLCVDHIETDKKDCRFDTNSHLASESNKLTETISIEV